MKKFWLALLLLLHPPMHENIMKNPKINQKSYLCKTTKKKSKASRWISNFWYMGGESDDEIFLFHLKIQITIVIMIIVITITIATINRWLQFSCCPPFVHFHFHVHCFHCHFSAFTFTIKSWLQFAGQSSTFNFYCFHFYFHNQ